MLYDNEVRDSLISLFKKGEAIGEKYRMGRIHK